MSASLARSFQLATLTCRPASCNTPGNLIVSSAAIFSTEALVVFDRRNMSWTTYICAASFAADEPPRPIVFDSSNIRGRESARLLVGLQRDQAIGVLPHLQKVNQFLRILNAEDDDIIDVIGLVLHADAAA